MDDADDGAGVVSVGAEKVAAMTVALHIDAGGGGVADHAGNTCTMDMLRSSSLSTL